MAIGDRIQRIILRAKDETRGAFASVSKSLKGLNNSLGTFASNLGLAFGLGTGGAVAAIKAMADEMDRMAKSAAKLGTTTEELSRLQYAAKITGVEARTLETGLQRMVRKIGDAANGSKEAADAFARLGLDFRALAQLTPEEQFIRIANAVQGLDSRTEQLSATVKIFDSEAAGLVNTLAGGEAGIRAAGAELERLGGVIDSDTAAAAERFNDNLDRMNVGLMNAARIYGGPLINNWANWLDVLTGAAGAFDLINARANNLVENIVPGTAEITAQIIKLTDELDSWTRTAFRSDESVARYRANINAQIDKLHAELSAKREAFAAQRLRQAAAANGAIEDLESKLTAYVGGELDARVIGYKDYVKQIDQITKDEAALIQRIEQAGRDTVEGIAAVQIGDTLEAGDLFLRFRDAISSLQGGDVDAARQTIVGITEAMDALNERGELNSVTANQLRENLASLASDIAAVGKQDIIDSARAQQQAADAAKDIEQTVRPRLKIELDPASIEQLKRSAEAAMAGFSVPVSVRPVVAPGPESAGITPTAGEHGEPTYSDVSAAEGYKP